MTFEEWWKEKGIDNYNAKYFSKRAWETAIKHEREECAKLCEEEAGKWKPFITQTLSAEGRMETLIDMAAEIRSRNYAN